VNQAVRKAWEKSAARGTAKLLLMAVAERAEGCVSRGTIAEFADLAGISVRTAYRDVEILENLQEIEKRTEQIEKKRFTAFHLLRVADCHTFGVSSALCTKWAAKLTDLRRQIPLIALPAISTSPLRTASGMLTGADLTEVEWLANRLRLQLGLRPKPQKGFALEP
jgi:hypothetical protein